MKDYRKEMHLYMKICEFCFSIDEKLLISSSSLFLKMEYSNIEKIVQSEVINKQEPDDDNIISDRKNLNTCTQPIQNENKLSSEKPRKLERYEVQCEVTVHADALSSKKNSIEDEKYTLVHIS